MLVADHGGGRRPHGLEWRKWSFADQQRWEQPEWANRYADGLFYPRGVSASFYCSFRAEIQQWASISGTRGALCVSDFVLPYFSSEVHFEVSNPVFHITGCDFNMEEHTRRVAVREYSNSAESAQETAMFGHFAELALSGKPDPYWGEIALKTQQVLDACLDSARSKGQMTEVIA
jgi:predicted dehydrogenase